MRRALVVLATLLLLALASGARAGIDSQVESGRGVSAVRASLVAVPTAPPAADSGIVGIASTWGGPGAATHDCIWPWKDCATRAVQSLDTGLVIVVRPQMYCDCFVGRTGPQGETERLIDLDPGMVRALGLDPAAGLWKVRIWLVDPATGIDHDQVSPLADTAMASP